MFAGKEKQLQALLDEYTASGVECGCQLAVYHKGKLLYDLASGYTDESKIEKITSDTLFPVFSAGKSVVTVLMLLLKQEKVFDIDEPVSLYWKEFGKNGKEKITIRNVLNHTSGLHNAPEHLKFEDYYKWDVFCNALADAAPATPPGEQQFYHGYTYATLCGKIAEKATGKPLLELIQEKICKPLGITDLYFNLPEEKYVSTAKIQDPTGNEAFLSHNKPYVLSGMNPSTNCCTNARSLGRMYTALLPSGADGTVLLTEDTIDEAVRFAFDPEKAFSPIKAERKQFGLGFVRFGEKGSPFRHFGQTGAAGSEGIADRETELVMAFTKNQNIPGKPIPEVRNKIAAVLGLPERK